MKRLSKVVNIVPVIAKADTLTLDERVYFKQRVGLSPSARPPAPSPLPWVRARPGRGCQTRHACFLSDGRESPRGRVSTRHFSRGSCCFLPSHGASVAAWGAVRADGRAWAAAV